MFVDFILLTIIDLKDISKRYYIKTSVADIVQYSWCFALSQTSHYKTINYLKKEYIYLRSINKLIKVIYEANY